MVVYTNQQLTRAGSPSAKASSQQYNQAMYVTCPNMATVDPTKDVLP